MLGIVEHLVVVAAGRNTGNWQEMIRQQVGRYMSFVAVEAGTGTPARFHELPECPHCTVRFERLGSLHFQQLQGPGEGRKGSTSPGSLVPLGQSFLGTNMSKIEISICQDKKFSGRTNQQLNQ